MIYIDRNLVPVPKELDPDKNPRLAKEMEEAKAYFGNKEKKRKQRRFEFRSHRNRNVQKALLELSHGKCAYCESLLEIRVDHSRDYGKGYYERKTSRIRADYEHYRPIRSVMELPDHSGYWWMANDWENLFMACPRCNRTKRNRFPIENESNRAFHSKDSISKESPLILNPCIDQPEDHFVYSDNGTVMSETERGNTTILVLDLNRDDLVERRRNAILQLKPTIEMLLGFANTKTGIDNKSVSEAIEKFKMMIREEEEFAGLKRQYVQAALKRFDSKSAAQKNLQYTRTYSNTKKKAVKKTYESYAKNIQNTSMNDFYEKSTKYMLKERFVKKLELTNIKTHENQTFHITGSDADSAPWFMLLGENGTGKSTILKSLCMNLCDANYFQKMVKNELVKPNNFIRHGTRKGTVKVWVTGADKPRTLEFKKNLIKFTNTEGESTTYNLLDPKSTPNAKIWTSPNFLLAYGATRLLPRGSKHEAKHIESEFSRLDNLFNPFVPLVDAEKWLLGLDDTLFRRAAIVIKDLLRMSPDDEIPRTKTDIKIMVNGSLEIFKELSDGYQSVIALTTDILQLVMTRWKNPDEARGIVLLDEIGAHLHPRWKMVMVNSLRKALPNMQFIVSTHQPLCLRGVEQGEVILMKRDADKNVEVITDLPNPKDLRISQILTSVFGLSSTMDPELEAEFNRYYELRAMNERTAEEDEEMNELRGILNPDLLLGETLLDTQVYNVVKEKYDQYKNDPKQNDVGKLKEDTLSAVQDLWSS